MKKIKYLLVIFCVFIFSQYFLVACSAQTRIDELEHHLETFVNEKMAEGSIPGLSLVIVEEGKTVYQKGFGYADLGSDQKVTSETLFEIGSNSKAFTALGVLMLEKEGLISLRDPITKYIPWLKMKYRGRETLCSIEHFLQHSSGVPTHTIVKIPATDAEDAIEETVRALVGIELDSKPGERYQYATINYDVLGLLIEKVSGKKYEEYIQESVLQPMELDSTIMYPDQSDNKMAKGYKIGFFKPRCYQAPTYSGNKPAGYIISNAKDMAKWLKIQLGTATSRFDQKLVENSHLPKQTIESAEVALAYGAGWLINNTDGLEIFHSGSNPNYSSYLAFRPQEKIGVAILSNIQSSYTTVIGQGIINLLRKKDYVFQVNDFNRLTDQIALIIILFATLSICFSVYFFLKFINQIMSNKRSFQGKSIIKILKILIFSISAFVFSYLIHYIPYVLLNKSSWNFIFVWYPNSIRIAIYLVYISIGVVHITILIKSLFKKPALEVQSIK